MGVKLNAVLCMLREIAANVYVNNVLLNSGQNYTLWGFSKRIYF